MQLCLIYIRSALFSVFVPVWTLLNGIFFLPFLLAKSPFVVNASKSWCTVMLWGLRHICHINYETRGLDNIPDQPCIIACKHQSAWETVVLCLMFDTPSFVLKKELLSIPFYGWYLHKIGMISVDRSGGGVALKHMVRDVSEKLEDGKHVIIFPEGTRTQPYKHLPYQAGVSALYTNKQIDAPIVPAALNSGMFWSKQRFLKYPGTVILEFLPPIASGLTRNTFMETLEKQVEGTSTRLADEAQKERDGKTAPLQSK